MCTTTVTPQRVMEAFDAPYSAPLSHGEILALVDQCRSPAGGDAYTRFCGNLLLTVERSASARLQEVFPHIERNERRGMAAFHYYQHVRQFEEQLQICRVLWAYDKSGLEWADCLASLFEERGVFQLAGGARNRLFFPVWPVNLAEKCRRRVLAGRGWTHSEAGERLRVALRHLSSTVMCDLSQFRDDVELAFTESDFRRLEMTLARHEKPLRQRLARGRLSKFESLTSWFLNGTAMRAKGRHSKQLKRLEREELHGTSQQLDRDIYRLEKRKPNGSDQGRGESE
jgi:hypothetical protein